MTAANPVCPTSLQLPVVVGCALSLAAVGCGGASPAAKAPSLDRLAPANLYPMSEGNVWSYDVDDGTDLPTLAITRVVSAEGARYEVSSNRGEPVVYERRDGGLFRPATDTWLLKAPIREGAQWESASGMTAEVVSVHEALDTPAGRFEGCVRVQESGGDSGRRIATVYCPGIGPVQVESVLRTQVREMTARVVARLRGYQLAE